MVSKGEVLCQTGGMRRRVGVSGLIVGDPSDLPDDEVAVIVTGDLYRVVVIRFNS